eukprot:tig00001086_g6839.t1
MAISDPWDHWRALGAPRWVAAPMIDGSELAFRMLVREHGAVGLAWSPMLHADAYLNDPAYCAEIFTSCAADTPLVVQLGGSDAETMARAAQAALAVAPHAAAVDINLGCPQDVAKRGGYGAFLCDRPEAVRGVVRALRAAVAVPVWAKMRLLGGPLARTLEFARMLEAEGVGLLTVHGRTRHQFGHAAGEADWAAVRAVREAVGIPVVANGSVASAEAAERCLRETGAAAAMSAEALLYDPFLFARAPAPGAPAAPGRPLPSTPLESSLLYLEYAGRYGASVAYARSHVARLWGHRNPKKARPNPVWMGPFWFTRQSAWGALGAAASLAEMRTLVETLPSLAPELATAPPAHANDPGTHPDPAAPADRAASPLS